MRVIFVKIGFRDGYPEISRDNPMFSRIVRSGGFIEGRTSEIHPAVAPRPGDIVITKRRVSAFASTDLDAVLRVNGIDSLVLSGMSTSGVVLSTMRAAADLDFDLTVLSDGCADNDTECHRVLMERIFPRQASVVTVEQWIAALGGSGETG
jgi:nicotinamidase-related amidase